MRGTLEERFWAKVDKSAGPDGCWLWTASRNPHGYGRIAADSSGRLVCSHRVSWELAHGPIPDGLFVLHNCPDGDNPACVNPAHLWLGTHVDNMHDMACKGRDRAHTHPETLARGEKHGSRTHPERVPRGERSGAHTHPERVARGERQGNAKLVKAQVLEIRMQYAQGSTAFKVLAAQYGVTRGAIRLIVRRVNWKHI